jgi:hypothetical protein
LDTISKPKVHGLLVQGRNRLFFSLYYCSYTNACLSTNRSLTHPILTTLSECNSTFDLCCYSSYVRIQFVVVCCFVAVYSVRAACCSAIETCCSVVVASCSVAVDSAAVDFRVVASCSAAAGSTAAASCSVVAGSAAVDYLVH